MSVTIQEVAEAAGVSKATVSKVLHKSYSISQETCDRVNAVIKELGYQPNRRAQSFATGATKTILFLAEMQHGVGFDNPHLFEIMAGVENALSEKGYGLIVQHSTALDLWQHFDELLQGSYVDGVILHASVVSQRMWLFVWPTRNCPTLLWVRRISPTSFVGLIPITRWLGKLQLHICGATGTTGSHSSVAPKKIQFLRTV